MVSVGLELQNISAGWFWVSHEVTFRMSVEVKPYEHEGLAGAGRATSKVAHSRGCGREPQCFLPMGTSSQGGLEHPRVMAVGFLQGKDREICPVPAVLLACDSVNDF